MVTGKSKEGQIALIHGKLFFAHSVFICAGNRFCESASCLLPFLPCLSVRADETQAD